MVSSRAGDKTLLTRSRHREGVCAIRARAGRYAPDLDLSAANLGVGDDVSDSSGKYLRCSGDG